MQRHYFSIVDNRRWSNRLTEDGVHILRQLFCSHLRSILCHLPESSGVNRSLGDILETARPELQSVDDHRWEHRPDGITVIAIRID